METNNERGKCVYCNADLTGHYNNFPKFEDNYFVFEWTCDCGASGSESYVYQFDGHIDYWIDKEKD